MRFYYNEPGPAQRDLKFVGYTTEDVRNELDQDSAFGISIAIEARFRMDFLLSCSERRKDVLSRHFRNLSLYRLAQDMDLVFQEQGR